jgi:polyisoprenoid-binding protein YceI
MKKSTNSNKRNPTKMKTTMNRSLIALVIAALALGSLVSARAAVETYNIDPVHTWVGFSIAISLPRCQAISAR